MIVDIVKDFRDFSVGGTGFDIAERIGQKASVQFDEKLYEQAAAVQSGGILVIRKRTFQFFTEFKKSGDRGG